MKETICGYGIKHSSTCRCSEIYVCRELEIKSAYDFANKWCRSSISSVPTQEQRDEFLIEKEKAIRKAVTAKANTNNAILIALSTEFSDDLELLDKVNRLTFGLLSRSKFLQKSK